MRVKCRAEHCTARSGASLAACIVNDTPQCEYPSGKLGGTVVVVDRVWDGVGSLRLLPAV